MQHHQQVNTMERPYYEEDKAPESDEEEEWVDDSQFKSIKKLHEFTPIVKTPVVNPYKKKRQSAQTGQPGNETPSVKTPVVDFYLKKKQAPVNHNEGVNPNNE